MLLWVADIIVAADDADVPRPGAGAGVNGVEVFAHLWELGHRKAKELLFTGDALSADDALRIGMVNHVVPQPSCRSAPWPSPVASAHSPRFALKLAKESINQSLDLQGYTAAVKAAFGCASWPRPQSGAVRRPFRP